MNVEKELSEMGWDKDQIKTAQGHLDGIDWREYENTPTISGSPAQETGKKSKPTTPPGAVAAAAFTTSKSNQSVGKYSSVLTTDIRSYM